MATEEMKQETKNIEQKQETKKTKTKQSPEANNLPPPPLPLLYKTCSFKVSIHCEGCKRKVKKILTSIEGVYKVDIDVKLHKVTVMGIIPPEILLKKLLKAGKNADLLPQKPDPVDNKPVNSKEDKPVNPEENKPVDPKVKNKKNKTKEEKTEIIDKRSSSGSVKPESEKNVAAGECDSGDGNKTCAPVKEENQNIRKERDSVSADSPVPTDLPSPAEKKSEENGGDVGSVNVGKKKKKKGQKSTNSNDSTGTPTCTQPVPPPVTTPTTTDQDRSFIGHPPLTNNNPPRHDMFPYIPSYYAPQVMYGVSYNVAQSPASVDGASYYTPQPSPYSYAYMHPGYLPSDLNPYQSRPADSYELFSDENPNGCSVM